MTGRADVVDGGGKDAGGGGGFSCVACLLRQLLLLLSSSASPAISLGFTIFGEIFAYVTVFVLSNHRGSHIPTSWMVHAGCVFVAGIHPSRT